MRRPSSTSSAAGDGSAKTSSKKVGWLRIAIRSHNISTGYVVSKRPCDVLDLRDIFGSSSEPGNDPSTPSGERCRRVLLDPAVRAALRDGAPARARVPA